MKKLVSALFAFAIVASLTSATVSTSINSLDPPSEATQDACMEDGLDLIADSGLEGDEAYEEFGNFYDFCIALEHEH